MVECRPPSLPNDWCFHTLTVTFINILLTKGVQSSAGSLERSGGNISGDERSTEAPSAIRVHKQRCDLRLNLGSPSTLLEKKRLRTTGLEKAKGFSLLD